jgi:hypothetical protein
MLEALRAVWAAISQDSSLVPELAISVVVLMYSHVHIWVASRARLRDKDRHIEDLIRERNRLQTFLFQQQGRERLTSQKDGP